MPSSRRGRIYVPGVSVHVYPRGINHAAIAFDEIDYERLLRIIVKAAGDYDVAIHAFALMKTHHHVIVTSRDAKGLGAMMRVAGSRYTRYFNRRYRRTGPLWNERYGAVPIQDERYWYTCLRYVDLNPFRAHIVDAPEDWSWCSYRFHAFGERCDWLTPHPLYLRLGATAQVRQMAYRVMCGTPLTDEELDEQRHPPRAPDPDENVPSPDSEFRPGVKTLSNDSGP
jgi:putative transposase